MVKGLEFMVLCSGLRGFHLSSSVMWSDVASTLRPTKRWRLRRLESFALSIKSSGRLALVRSAIFEGLGLKV